MNDSEATAIAEKRSIVCSDCPEIKKMGFFSRITSNDKIVKIAEYKCSVCDCPLSSKLRVKKEQCPKDKW